MTGARRTGAADGPEPLARDDAREAGTRLHSVLGELEPEPGWLFYHEHLAIDLGPDRRLADLDAVRESLVRLRSQGVTAVVDATGRGMGRDPRALAALQRDTGVAVVACAGYYVSDFHPPETRGMEVEAIAQQLRWEVRTGLDGTAHRPGAIGELGGSFPLRPDECRVLRAGARVALTEDLALLTHCQGGRGALAQLDLLEREGVRPDRVALGHLDLLPPALWAEVAEAAARGAYVGIDTVGKAAYAPDSQRLDLVAFLWERGLGDRILVSTDISRDRYLRRHGGHGYEHLLATFVPDLEARMGDRAVRATLRTNPWRWLTGRPAP